jgi:4-carboxymuconolactone decarboxylase
VVGTMIALGRWEELRMHVRTALASGALTIDELKEIVLQQAVYCGVPAANHALAELAGVVAEAGARG